VRSDKGTTLFTCDEKRKQVYTPLYVFKKIMRTANRGEELTDKELNDRWEVASPATKANAKQKAVQLLQRAPYLVDEITWQLKLTRGCVTWRTLIAQVAGSPDDVDPFKYNTVRKFVMSLPNSEYTKTYIHPKLTTACKQCRYNWSRAFYSFWETA
jgi:hypothetical protein